MSKITGRRSNGTLRKFGQAIGAGLDAMAEAAQAAADNQKAARVHDIDNEIAGLVWERNLMISQMSDPGVLEVEPGFDPTRPPLSYTERQQAKAAFPASAGEGRLTDCSGTFHAGNSSFNESHPACPYRDRAHGEHQFTARD